MEATFNTNDKEAQKLLWQLASVSNIYTLGVRTISGATTGVGSISFYDLTQ
jgi:hypothetical protein